MADNTITSVPSLLIPIDGDPLVLPNAAVAEIVGYREPEPVSDGPHWLLGLMQWRGVKIPLLSYEAIIGRAIPEPDRRVRIAVLNTLNANADVPFVGVILQGIPHLVRASDDNVVESSDHTLPTGALANVLVDTQPAIIPDLDALERMLDGGFG